MDTTLKSTDLTHCPICGIKLERYADADSWDGKHRIVDRLYCPAPVHHFCAGRVIEKEASKMKLADIGNTVPKATAVAVACPVCGKGRVIEILNFGGVGICEHLSFTFQITPMED